MFISKGQSWFCSLNSITRCNLHFTTLQIILCSLILGRYKLKRAWIPHTTTTMSSICKSFVLSRLVLHLRSLLNLRLLLLVIFVHHWLLSLSLLVASKDGLPDTGINQIFWFFNFLLNLRCANLNFDRIDNVLCCCVQTFSSNLIHLFICYVVTFFRGLFLFWLLILDA